MHQLNKLLWIILILLVSPSIFGQSVSELDAWIQGYTARIASAGSDRLLLAIVAGEEDGALKFVDSIKYGSIKLTKYIADSVGSPTFRNFMSVWYLLDANIPSGSNAFTVFWNTVVDDSAFGSAIYSGVDQSTPIDDDSVFKDISGNPDTGEVVLDVTDGSMVVVAANMSTPSINTAWHGATEAFEWAPPKGPEFSGAIAYQSQSAAGKDSVSAVGSATSTRFLMIGVNLKPAAAASSVPTKKTGKAKLRKIKL
jgi:hypothetical protein